MRNPNSNMNPKVWAQGDSSHCLQGPFNKVWACLNTLSMSAYSNPWDATAKENCPNEICEWGFCLFIRKSTQTMDCFISWLCTAFKSTLTGIIPIFSETSTSKFLNIVYPKWYHWEFDWGEFLSFTDEVVSRIFFQKQSFSLIWVSNYSQREFNPNTDHFFLNDLTYQIRQKRKMSR